MSRGALLKTARKAAQVESIGKPAREYEHTYFKKVMKRPDANGVPFVFEYQVCTSRLTRTCTRGIYRRIKKELRARGLA